MRQARARRGMSGEVVERWRVEGGKGESKGGGGGFSTGLAVEIPIRGLVAR